MIQELFQALGYGGDRTNPWPHAAEGVGLSH